MAQIGTNPLKYNVKEAQVLDQELFKSHSDYYSYVASNPQNYPQVDSIIIEGGNYETKSDEHSHLGTFEGIDNTLLTEESGSVTYLVNVSEAGFYRLLLTYFPQEGKSSNIERELKINGEIPFLSAENITFYRIWGNKDKISQDIYGNDIRPSQVEKPEWVNAYFKDSAGYVTEPFAFYFKEGENTIELTSIREPLIIGRITLEKVVEKKTYESVKQLYEQQGYKEIKDAKIQIQAENASFTTSPTLYPLNDRTSAKSSPTHHSKIKLNTIGGVNWRVAGDQISWTFEVEEDGLYEISLRVKQKFATGMSVSRHIYIDGEIPFKELENYEFKHSNAWRVQTLGTKKEAFKFYLTKGKHRITMETSLGHYGLLISEVNNSIQNLSKLYREILIFTGARPDEFRDYQLHIRIPDLIERIQQEYDMLTNIRKGLIEISGSRSEKTGILDTVLLQLKDFIKKPSQIHKKLLPFDNNIASLGTLMTLLDQQPLEIDYFVVHGKKHDINKGESLFESVWFGIKSFFGSFITDYSSVGKTTEATGEKIEVWLTVGKDQTNILRRLIDESFTPSKNIQVDLKLVNGASLLPATLSGVGPDVALGVGSSVPVNYAMRNAAYDLSSFSDFNEVKTQFKDSAFVPFRYLDKTYALPESQTFLMLFYRTDIFEELNLTVPNTWDEVIQLIPDLQKHHLEFYLPLPTTGGGVINLPPNPIYSTLFYQHDGEFYLEGGRKSGFSEGLGPKVFETWTQFYTDYSFPIEANFVNRFRSGQMPIGITYYNVYNTLSVFAPEIRGKWDFTLVPGTPYENEFGETEIRRETVSSTSATLMLKQTKKPEASWEFMKWWTSTETQVRFGREMEGILGAAARYPTANFEAMRQLPWTVKEYSKLEEQWTWVRGIPEVPGAYMTGRHLDNAFRLVINERSNPRETIYDYVQIINQELIKKRKEFGLE